MVQMLDCLNWVTMGGVAAKIAGLAGLARLGMVVETGCSFSCNV